MSCKNNHKVWAKKNHIGNIPKCQPPYNVLKIHIYKKAVIEEKDGKFTILAGSTVKFPTKGNRKLNKERFKDAIDRGDIIQQPNGDFIVFRDITFSSASAAVSIVNGYNSSGIRELT